MSFDRKSELRASGFINTLLEKISGLAECLKLSKNRLGIPDSFIFKRFDKVVIPKLRVDNRLAYEDMLGIFAKLSLGESFRILCRGLRPPKLNKWFVL